MLLFYSPTIQLQVCRLLAMSSKFKRIDTLPSERPLEEKIAIDWNLCILCQTKTQEPLICPAKRDGVGYKYVAENMREFERLGQYPFSVPVSKLSEGSELEDTFQLKRAKWHKRCRSKLGNVILNRKRKSSPSASPAKRRSSVRSDQSSNVCFFVMVLLVHLD